MENNKLYYGDNLEILRKYVKDDSIDLIYIDPPFNSNRNYNQIYNNLGVEDKAQAQAFNDTWTWDIEAEAAFSEIIANDQGRFNPQTVDLIKGMCAVLNKGSLLAYLVSMTLRVVELHRILKPSGSFFLHCDPTASHYLKIVLDTIFVAGGGDFLNEIIWHYLKWSTAQKQFVSNHDNIFFYAKNVKAGRHFETFYMDRSPSTKKRFGNEKIVSGYDNNGIRLPSIVEGESEGVALDDVWDISRVPPIKMLYPTQKPSLLLERIIRSTTKVGDIVLDAYCGCGTAVSVAQQLERKWVGIDITYQSISVILRRLEAEYGAVTVSGIELNGIPKDMASAEALANKKDDRVRKEFEKWSILTYSNNRAKINEKKGGDGGIDGIGYFLTGKAKTPKLFFKLSPEMSDEVI